MYGKKKYVVPMFYLAIMKFYYTVEGVYNKGG
jgi:hypothetical protein